MSVLSISDSLDSLTNTVSTGSCAQNPSVAPITQRSIARSIRLRMAAGMKSAAATSSPCASTIRMTVSNIVFCSPLEACDRQVREPETVLHERQLDLLDPDFVEALHARARVGGLLEHRAVAAAFAAGLIRFLRGRDQRLHRVGAGSHLGEPDGAGDRQRVVVHLEDPLGHPRDDVLRPRLDVAEAAALEEHREHLAAEPTVQVRALREHTKLLGELHEQVFARDRADAVLDLAKLVRPDVRERADAALGLAVEAIREHLEEAAPVIEAGGRILVDRLLDELLGLGLPLARLPGHADLDGRVAVVGRRLEHELERHRAAARIACADFERFPVPLPLRARDQRAFERGLARRVERVHQRAAERGVLIGVAEELGPGLIRVDDDAVLHVRDRVDRAGHEVFELAFVLARGLERLVQRALEAKRP